MDRPADTYSIRTRTGQTLTGMTLDSLRIGRDQGIFRDEDHVMPEGSTRVWTTLGRVLEGVSVPPVAPDLPKVSTGIALDLEATPAPPPRPMVPRPPLPQARAEAFTALPAYEEEGPQRHRLRLAGAFLLLSGIFGMVGYALGAHKIGQIITMLVNTGLGIALLMNREEVRKWAAGWVVAGWALTTFVGIVAGGCFGLVLVGFFTGLYYGGPACLLWGEDCPPGRFWTGVVLMALMALLALVVILAMVFAGAALMGRMGSVPR